MTRRASFCITHIMCLLIPALAYRDILLLMRKFAVLTNAIPNSD